MIRTSLLFGGICLLGCLSAKSTPGVLATWQGVLARTQAGLQPDPWTQIRTGIVFEDGTCLLAVPRETWRCKPNFPPPD